MLCFSFLIKVNILWTKTSISIENLTPVLQLYTFKGHFRSLSWQATWDRFDLNFYSLIWKYSRAYNHKHYHSKNDIVKSLAMCLEVHPTTINVLCDTCVKQTKKNKQKLLLYNENKM